MQTGESGRAGGRRLRLVGVGLGVAFVAIQLVPVDRTNPPVTGEIQAPTAVQEVLERSCYDCHSNQTSWPWYSRVAPASWLVAWDVAEAREHLNFSEWSSLAPKKKADAIHEIWEEVEEGEMPLWYYLPAHPEARLSDADREALRAWSVSAGGEDHDHEEH
jgi:hypothetical protein